MTAPKARKRNALRTGNRPSVTLMLQAATVMVVVLVIGSLLLVHRLSLSDAVRNNNKSQTVYDNKATKTKNASVGNPFLPESNNNPRIFLPYRDWTKDLAAPKGSFIFRETKLCASATTTSSSCQIHFPSDSVNQNLVCDLPAVFKNMFPSSRVCLRTVKGFKPPVSMEDEQPPQPLAIFAPAADDEGVPNQDRALLIQPLSLKTAPGITETDCMLLLLADGHGPFGHMTAAAVQKYLPFHILNLLQWMDPKSDPKEFMEEVPVILKKAFLDCDQHLMKMGIEKSGSTAIVVLKIGSIVFLASLGDSTAIVASRRKDTTIEQQQQQQQQQHQQQQQQQPRFQVIATAVRHKPHMPDERQRIEQLGGQIYIPFSLKEESSRVLLPGGLALAMSRCMGDFEGKTQGWLLAEPTVLTVPLEHDEGQEYFILVASDGVIDYHPLAEVVEKVGAALLNDDADDGTSSSTLGKSMDSILKESEQHWFRVTNGEYRDDMTLVVSRVVVAAS